MQTVRDDGRLLAADAKLNFDDNALYRHEDIAELRDLDEEDPLEVRAQESGSTAALVAFGFLLALFGSGLVVSLVQALLAFRGPTGRASADATH